MNPEINLDLFDCVVFDMDGTLAQSKGPISNDMADCLNRLLKIKSVAVISGGMFSQFEKQLVSHLETDNLNKLYILPTSGASMWTFNNGIWSEIYRDAIEPFKRRQIIEEIQRALDLVGYQELETFGQIIEDRISQITFSALGDAAPIENKKVWDPDQKKRKLIASILKERIPEYTITIGGTTSIDITLKGVDKAYGVEKISKILNIPLPKILFIGDKLQFGGNDYPVKRLEIGNLEVKDEHETERLLNSWLT